MFFEVKIEKNQEKNDSKNIVFLAWSFQWILGGFGKGFGKVLGGGCDLLGVSWGTFFPMGDGEKHVFPDGGPKRRPRGLLDSIWGGFGRGLGGVWEPFGGSKLTFFWFLLLILLKIT